MGTIYKPGTSSSQPCAIQTEYMPYTFTIGFLDTQFSSNCHFYILWFIGFENSQCDWEHVEKILHVVLWNSSGQFWKYAPLKVVLFFLVTRYAGIQNMVRTTRTRNWQMAGMNWPTTVIFFEFDRWTRLSCSSGCWFPRCSPGCSTRDSSHAKNSWWLGRRKI